MFEYAISRGEGTLIDHGLAEYEDLYGMIDYPEDGETVIFAQCDEDCRTGK